MLETEHIPLTPAVIERYKEILFTPEKHGHPDAPKWTNVIKKDTVCIAKSVLYEEVKKVWPSLPKVVFYIIANDYLQQGYDPNNNLGYFAKVVSRSGNN